MSDKDLREHESSDKIKWILTAVAILLIGVFLAALCTQGFKTYDPWGWFNKEDANAATVAQAGGMVESEKLESGISLMSAVIPVSEYAAYGISPTSAELAMTLTATITPSDASNTAVDWTIAFANPSSSWANGKTVTNYVTVVPESDGALTAVVTCKSAFGEQVVVTVASRENPDATATCTFDYVKRITGADVSLSPTELKFSTQYTVSVTPQYSVGTVSGDYEETGYSLILSEALKDEIGGSYNYRAIAVLTTDVGKKTVSLGANAYTTFVQSGGTASEFNNAFARAVSAVLLAHASFTVAYSYTYASKDYKGAAFVVDLKFDASSLTIGVTDVTLSESHYYF